MTHLFYISLIAFSIPALMLVFMKHKKYDI